MDDSRSVHVYSSDLRADAWRQFDESRTYSNSVGTMVGGLPAEYFIQGVLICKLPLVGMRVYPPRIPS